MKNIYPVAWLAGLLAIASFAEDEPDIAISYAGEGTLELRVNGVSNKTCLLEVAKTLSASNAWSYGDSCGPSLTNGPITLRNTVPGNPSTLFGRMSISSQVVERGSARYVPSGYSFVWNDQFSGATIDSNKWVVASLRDPVSGNLVPGAAGDHLLNTRYSGYVTEDDCYVSAGSLFLLNQKRSYTGTSPAGNYQYTSGWVMSMHRALFNKGYIEIRAQFPSGDKVWPAIWMCAEDLSWGPEWDLWEYFGYRSDVGYDNMGNHLASDSWPNVKWNTSWIKNYDAIYDCEAWHVYGFEWTTSNAVWTVDGLTVNTLLKSDLVNPSLWPNEDMYIILNNGVKTDSPDTTTTWPNSLQIDYVEVYQ